MGESKKYIDKRFEEILSSTTIQDMGLGFGNAFKLGQATVTGFFLALMETNDDFTAEDFKVVMKQFIKDDVQLRCDTYGIMGEYMAREDIEVK